jgi:hypothetical protein
MRRACEFDGIPNECLGNLPRRPLVHLTHLFHHCLWLSHFPKPWKEAKFITVSKPKTDGKFSYNLHPISILSTMVKLFEKVILKIVQRHIEGRGLLNASQFGFHACQSTTIQCMRLPDHVTLNFNNVYGCFILGYEKVFDTTWHLSLPY